MSKTDLISIGGVALDDIQPRTMESKKGSVRYFAGEVITIDGPTGGYTLQAAFPTARLAIADIRSH